MANNPRSKTANDNIFDHKNIDINSISSASSIVSKMAKYSFARQNRFIIEFSLPVYVYEYVKSRDSTFSSGIDSERFRALKFNCHRASTPDRNISVLDIRDSSHNSLVASFGSLNNTISLSFICFADMKEKVLMDYWYEYIFSQESRTMMFLDDYSTTITMYQLDGKNKPTYGIKMLSAFPSNVQGSQYDYQPSSMPVNLDVRFTFSEIETFDYINSSRTSDSKSSNRSKMI